MDTQQHIAQLLEKYAEGTCAPEEKAIVEAWYASLHLEPPHGANAAPQQGDRLWEQIASRTEGGKRRVQRRYLAMTAAAAAVLLTAAAAFWLFRSAPAAGMQQIAASEGKVVPLTLPDGSRIWLGRGASVRYEPGFAQGRSVVLEQGEAFFDVKQDDQRPFTVEARGTRTRVLGTSFRINAGGAGQSVEVTVISGKVQVEDEQRRPVILGRRESVAIRPNSTLKAEVAPVATPAAPAREAWQSNSLELDNVSTGELALLLESIYNVRFSFAEDRLRNCMNTISINTSRPLSEVLDKLKLINHFEYTITSEGIMINGAGCGS